MISATQILLLLLTTIERPSPNCRTAVPAESPQFEARLGTSEHGGLVPEARCHGRLNSLGKSVYSGRVDVVFPARMSSNDRADITLHHRHCASRPTLSFTIGNGEPYMLRLLLLISIPLCIANQNMAAEHRFFIGTYTRGDSISDGIYTAVFNDETGGISEPVLAAETDNPSFLAIHPNGRFLFAVNENNDYEGRPTGAVSAFRIDADTGRLSLINQRATEGGAPCHCVVDPQGRFLLIANYTGGNAIVFPISEDGSLGAYSCLINHTGSGPDPSRQEGPHAHSINLSSDNRYAYVADLGIDRVMIYRFDPQEGLLVPGSPETAAVAPGGGPRHFCIHPSGRFAYTNHELSAEVTMFHRDPASGGLTARQTLSTLPADFSGRKSTSECLLNAAGTHLYVSNRGHESIAVYSVSPDDGELTPVEIQNTGGEEPRNFNFDPSGKWLLAENQNSDTIITFAVDPKTGRLTQTDNHVKVGRPICIRFLD